MRHEATSLRDGKHLNKGAQTLIRVPGEARVKALTDLLEGQLSKGERKVVLLSTVHSAIVLQRRLPLSKLPKGSLRVLDAISLGYGAAQTIAEGFVYLQTPASLESMLASIDRAFSGKPHFDTLIIDSLDTFSSRFALDASLEFFRFLQVRMSEKEATVNVLDGTRGAPNRLYEELSTMFDVSIDLSKGGGTE